MTSIALNPTDTLHLVALDRPQLEAAHAKMIEWAKARRDKVDVDVDVESTNLDLAAQNGWLTQPFERRLNALARQRTFYDKIVAALEAGYAIVPNFPMDIFAIRTKAKETKGNPQKGSYNRFIQSAQLLPVGDGRYVDPAPHVITQAETTKNAKGEDVKQNIQWPADEFDEVGFPVALARPELMTRVGHAMASKIFDQVGVVDDRSGDPVIVGRILNPRNSRPNISFFLGWHFDPSRL